MPVWTEVLLAWIVLGSLLNLLAFRKGYMKMISRIENGYEEGYRDAEMNIRMYYGVAGKLPSTIWVKQSRDLNLDTRTKLLEFGLEEQKSNN